MLTRRERKEAAPRVLACGAVSGCSGVWAGVLRVVRGSAGGLGGPQAPRRRLVWVTGAGRRPGFRPRASRVRPRPGNVLASVTGQRPVAQTAPGHLPRWAARGCARPVPRGARCPLCTFPGDVWRVCLQASPVIGAGRRPRSPGGVEAGRGSGGNLEPGPGVRLGCAGRPGAVPGSPLPWCGLASPPADFAFAEWSWSDSRPHPRGSPWGWG